MKKNVRAISLTIAALLLVSACFCITGCKKHEVKMTEKNNKIKQITAINKYIYLGGIIFLS